MQGGMLMVAGVALGVMGSFAISKRLADQLYRTSPSDVLTLVTVPLLILIVGLGAVYTSAIVATRTDPARSLRGE